MSKSCQEKQEEIRRSRFPFMLLRRIGLLVMAVASLFAAGHAAAEEFPNKVVRIVVPYPPGGSAETQARIIGQKLTEAWGQQVIVESKPGAGTTIAATYVAKSLPDGYTLYLAGTSHTISASLYKGLPYDAVKSFAPVSLLAISPFILATGPGKSANSLKELVEQAKAAPGKLSYGSSGSGAGPHLSGELFRMQAGIDVIHVPFKGSAPAMTALMGSHIDYMIADVAAIPFMQTGKMKALAVTTSKRSALLPDVPTFAEAGMAGYETVNWSAILAPAGTPPDIVKKINASIIAALKTADVRQRLNAQGFEPLGSTPEELRTHMIGEVAKYAKAIKEAGAKVD
jgi:tripartite-type tricarboxylate transporter receptor subunit TctC